ncbi:MAG: hypothetical protein ABJN26_10470 [Stappiaceae bacterium]
MSALPDNSAPLSQTEIRGSGAQARMVLGTLTAELKTADQTDHQMMAVVPQLSLFADGERIARMTGSPATAETVNAQAQFLELDPTNHLPELALTSFSGGAHCCTEIKVATSVSDGSWRVVDLGIWNGSEARFVDANSNGSLELVQRDNDFLYAFDCYACSAAPLQILAVRDGKASDVSRDPSFHLYHRTYLNEMERQTGMRGDTFSPGFWAGWVAQKALLGEGKEAFGRMLSAYNPMRDEGYMSCADGRPDCPVREEVFQSYPVALKRFLDYRNYSTE